jgi:hypothetical protein
MYHKRRRAGFKRLQREFRFRCPLTERFPLLSSSGGAKRRPPVCLPAAELTAFPTVRQQKTVRAKNESPSWQAAMFDRAGRCNEEEDLRCFVNWHWHHSSYSRHRWPRRRPQKSRSSAYRFQIGASRQDAPTFVAAAESGAGN